MANEESRRKVGYSVKTGSGERKSGGIVEVKYWRPMPKRQEDGTRHDYEDSCKTLTLRTVVMAFYQAIINIRDVVPLTLSED